MKASAKHRQSCHCGGHAGHDSDAGQLTVHPARAASLSPTRNHVRVARGPASAGRGFGPLGVRVGGLTELCSTAGPVTFTLKLPQPNKLNGPPGDPASAASHWHGAATHDPRDSDDNH